MPDEKEQAQALAAAAEGRKGVQAEVEGMLADILANAKAHASPDPSREAEDDEETEDVQPTEQDAPDKDEAEKAREDGLMERLWARLQPLLGNKAAADEMTAFKVVGNHWIATWTNAYKDRDRQFFPEAEIAAYIRRVDMGVTPEPELWIWHGGRKTRVGVAEQVDGHGRFGIAAGVFDDTPLGRKARDFYANPRNARETRLSHGFTYPSKDFDGETFRSFNTFEISLLPKGVEANLFTSLEGVKAMQITTEKRKYYEKVFGKDFDHILSNLEEKDKALEDLGAAYKDFTGDALEADEKALDSDLTAAFKDLFPQLVEGQAEVTTAVKDVLKVVGSFDKRMKAIEAFMAETPKRASKAVETELDEDDEEDKKVISQIELEKTDEKAAKAFPGLFNHKSDINTMAKAQFNAQNGG
jgi:hypothetical protein